MTVLAVSGAPGLLKKVRQAAPRRYSFHRKCPVFCQSPAWLDSRPGAGLTSEGEGTWSIQEESFTKWPQGASPPPTDLSSVLRVKTV